MPPVAVVAGAVALVVIVGVVALVRTSGHGGVAVPVAVRQRPPSAPVVRRTPAPTTTVPAPPATLVSSSPSDAVYSLTGPASITFTASGGVSWIEMRQGSQTGPVVFEGNLSPGQAQTVTGPAWVRLGNPTAVDISVNRTAIPAPGFTAGEPYNLQFR